MASMKTNQWQLPVEIIESILHYYIEDCKTTTSDPMNSAEQPFLEDSALVQLLRLRLINRSWSIAVTPYAYRTLNLNSALMTSNLVRTWKTTLKFPNMSQLQRLCFNKIEYENSSVELIQAIEVSKNSELDLKGKEFNVSSTLMSDVAEMISLCSTTLSELKFIFDSAVGFTSEMIDSIKQVENLTVLIINGRPFTSDGNDDDSLKNLLNAVTPLESLSLMFAPIKSLQLKTTALPHLKHLCFLYDRGNNDAIYNFSQDQKDKITFLECVRPSHREDAMGVILGLQNSLEILFMDSIPDGLAHSILGFRFPRLRIMRCITCSSMRPDLRWLTFPIFENLEVFITSLYLTRKYWIQKFRSLKSNQFVKPVNWKLLILITEKGEEIQEDKLVKMFKNFGIRCEFKDELSYKDILMLKGSEKVIT